MAGAATRTFGAGQCAGMRGCALCPRAVRPRVQGWASGTSSDSRDALLFAQRASVRPMIETFSLAQAQAAVEHMMGGRARFRAVIQVVSEA